MSMSICSTWRDISNVTGLQAVDGDSTVVIMSKLSNIFIHYFTVSIASTRVDIGKFLFYAMQFKVGRAFEIISISDSILKESIQSALCCLLNKSKCSTDRSFAPPPPHCLLVKMSKSMLQVGTAFYLQLTKTDPHIDYK